MPISVYVSGSPPDVVIPKYDDNIRILIVIYRCIVTFPVDS